MIDNGILIISTRSLTVFRERIQRLIDQFDVILIDVVAQQTEKSGLRATDRIEKLQRFANKIVIGFVVVLQSEIVLIEGEKSRRRSASKEKGNRPEIRDYGSRRAVGESVGLVSWPEFQTLICFDEWENFYR